MAPLHSKVVGRRGQTKRQTLLLEQEKRAPSSQKLSANLHPSFTVKIHLSQHHIRFCRARARYAHNSSQAQVHKGFRAVTRAVKYSPHSSRGSPGLLAQEHNMLALAKQAKLKPAYHKHLQHAVSLACDMEPAESSYVPGMAGWRRLRDWSRVT